MARNYKVNNKPVIKCKFQAFKKTEQMRIRTLLIITVSLLGLHNTSRADKIIYNGTTYNLYGYPLQFNTRFEQWKITPIFGENANDKVFAVFDVTPYTCAWLVRDNHIYSSVN